MPVEVSVVRSAVRGMSEGKVTWMRQEASTGISRENSNRPSESSPTVVTESTRDNEIEWKEVKLVTCNEIVSPAMIVESI